MSNDQPQVLRVLAGAISPSTGSHPMVPHYESGSPQHGGSPQRWVTHTREVVAGPSFIDADGTQRHHGAWLARIGDPHEIPLKRMQNGTLKDAPYLTEYKRHLRDGDLLPADEFTAQWAGLDWTKIKPIVDEHHGEAAKDAHEADVTELRARWQGQASTPVKASRAIV